MDLLALTDHAYEAQCALSSIKSFAYGSAFVTESDAREHAAALRRQADQIETLLTGENNAPA